MVKWAWFPKYYVENEVLEIGLKDSILYLMKDEKHAIPLYYFKRISQNPLIFQSKKTMFLFHHKVIMSFTKMEN